MPDKLAAPRDLPPPTPFRHPPPIAPHVRSSSHRPWPSGHAAPPGEQQPHATGAVEEACASQEAAKAEAKGLTSTDPENTTDIWLTSSLLSSAGTCLPSAPG